MTEDEWKALDEKMAAYVTWKDQLAQKPARVPVVVTVTDNPHAEAKLIPTPPPPEVP